MRGCLWVGLLALVLGPSGVGADEKQPVRRFPHEDAADAVVAAVEAEDAAALEALAQKDEPDVWLVADELCARGRHDAADAFARAAPRPDVETLPAYIAADRGRGPDPEGRARLREVGDAIRARQAGPALERTEALGDTLDTVVLIRLSHRRAFVFQATSRLKECAAVARRGAEAALAIGWLTRASGMLHMAGSNAYRSSDYEQAIEIWTLGMELSARRGNEAGVAAALTNRGLAEQELGRYAQALASYEDSIARFELLGDRRGVASAMSNVGNVHTERGDFAQAIAAHEQALALNLELGNKAGAARNVGNIANAHYLRGDYPKALPAQEEALRQQEAVGDRASVARTLGNIGLVHAGLGNFTKALRLHERSRAEREALGDRAGVAASLINMGVSYGALGEYAKALAVLEEGLALAQAVGHRQWIANALGDIGSIHRSLGSEDRALAIYERTLEKMHALGDKPGVAGAIQNIGSVYLGQGLYEEALARFEQARAEAQALGDLALIASTLLNVGQAKFVLGKRSEALELYRESIAKWKEIGNRAQEAEARQRLGYALMVMGEYEPAREAMEQSRRMARSLRASPLLVTSLVGLADLHLRQGDPGRALGWARDALDEVEGLVGGLGEEQGATARGLHANLFAIGTLAAVREDDLAEALTFLESGRAGALLDALGKREQLRWRAQSLPPTLRKADQAARAAERARRHEYDRAAQTGSRKSRRDAAAALDAASEVVREVAGRIQRELKQQAGLYYPRARSIEDIEAALEPNQALVVYGLCVDEALALVLRHDGARVVALGSAAAVGQAVEALDATSPDADPSAALGMLRKRVVAPLGLADEVTQVLVSPEGPLCYVPFGALFDRPVAMTPSGTTHVLLLEQGKSSGEAVLAVGDPDYGGVSEGARAAYYRGRPLAPLPATRKEIETIGTKTLLGAEATEPAVQAAVATSKGWRAVHFACHGLVNVDRPMLSSLALASTSEEDGFLTALEILRMRIPADLAVLSACETGRGKIVKGEGIVGLTRAFMFAGSPRVLCSLWKVDDAATQALMLKFYELWQRTDGKRLGAAAALQKAQAFIRNHPDHPHWKHPYYWAAWVLWGLPS